MAVSFTDAAIAACKAAPWTTRGRQRTRIGVDLEQAVVPGSCQQMGRREQADPAPEPMLAVQRRLRVASRVVR